MTVLRHVVTKLGMKMTDEQIADMIKVGLSLFIVLVYLSLSCLCSSKTVQSHIFPLQIADKDGDGDVNYLEFMRLMKK